MKFYYSPGTCSLSPHIVAREVGMPLDLVRVDLRSTPHRTEDGADYAATVTAKGYVPALELDDGSLLTEGAAIVQYLADQAPATGLAHALPSDSSAAPTRERRLRSPLLGRLFGLLARFLHGLAGLFAGLFHRLADILGRVVVAAGREAEPGEAQHHR